MPVNRAAVLAQRQGIQSVDSPFLVSPIGGLNTRDALNAMPETDAIQLDNWFPGVDGMDIAKDYSTYATGLGGAVEFAAEYHSSDTRKFLAASGDSIFDVSVGGAATLIENGFGSARWNHVNFNARMILVNGVDDPQTYYNGAVSPSGFTGSGLTVSNLVGVASYRNRLFFFENDSQDFWYAGLNSITGTLTKYELSLVGRVGGNLVAIKTISRDGGNGTDDYIAFYMSSGEVFVYQGGDPGDADNWSLVGRYRVGEPIHQRAVLEYGSDVLSATKSDLVKLTETMTLSPEQIVPSKLSGAIAAAARRYGDNYGWQTVYFPNGNMVLINVPVKTGLRYWQYGFNTVTKAAFRFTYMDALCFGTYNNDLYFGGNDGTIYKAWVNTRSHSITAEVQQAYSPLGSGGRKRLKGLYCTDDITGSVGFTHKIGVDYGTPVDTVNYSSTTVGTPWGSPWGSPWSQPGYINRDKVGAAGEGKVFSLYRKATITAQDVTWYGTNFKYQPVTKY